MIAELDEIAELAEVTRSETPGAPLDEPDERSQPGCVGLRHPHPGVVRLAGGGNAGVGKRQGEGLENLRRSG